MNLNQSVKYQLYDMKRAITTFYFIVLVISFGLIVLSYLPDKGAFNVRVSMRGLEIASTIFLFVAGMNSFKEVFLMFLQNSISRKTLFVGRLVSVGVIGLGMALIDNLLSRLFEMIIPASSRLDYGSIIVMMYGLRYKDHSSGFLMTLEGILFVFFLYAAVSMMGYFITTLYYRMNKSLKTVVSIGVPVLLFIVWPVLDTLVLNNAINRALERFMTFAFGFYNGANPYFGMVTLLLICAAFSGLSWLLIRKAPIKE